MTYEMSAHRSRDKQTERNTNRAAAVAFPIGALGGAIPFCTAMANTPDADPLGLIIFVGVVVGFALGLMAVLATALTYNYLIAPKNVIAKLPHHARTLIENIEQNYETVLKLRPPATVVEELVELKRQHNEVVNELLSLKQALPDEDLSPSAPYRWLSTLNDDLQALRDELEAVRLQSYSLPRAQFSLEASREAVSEEREFLEAVLSKDSEEAFVDRLLAFHEDAPINSVQDLTILEALEPRVSLDSAQISSKTLTAPSKVRDSLTRLEQDGLVTVDRSAKHGPRYTRS